MLSLSEAIRSGRVSEFVAQEEARGVGPISEADFDDLAAKVIRTSQSADQTSGSLPAGGLPGK
jgi:hypothetical protein